MQPTFSVVLIARNESKTLPRLVASLEQFKARGGEIVLMDTGSSDGTAQIARDLGCVVHEVGDRFTHILTKETAEDINLRFVRPFKEEDIVKEGDRIFDFANARNHAASLAKNDMVAMPDCDEVYTMLYLDGVEEIIRAGADQLEYNFVFAHDEHGGEVVKFLHSKFYNRAKMRWVGIIHEVLQHNPGAPVNRVRLGEDVIKLEHWQNPETNRSGYLKGLALSVVHEPTNDRNQHYFGRELLYTGRPKSAIRQLEVHLALSTWAEERSQSQIHIGDAYMSLGQTKEAIHSWIDAFDTCPTRREPLMKIAEYYYRVKSPDHVIVYANAALNIPQSSFYASFQPYYEHLPHEFLYWAYWHKGDKALAHFHFKQCIKRLPYHSQYLHDIRLFEDLPKVSIVVPTLREDGLGRLLESIDKLNYPKDKIELITLIDAPRLGVPKRVKEGYEKSTGEWIVYAADDMEFHPDCIIAALQAAKNADPERGDLGFVAFNSGTVSPDEGNICEHFMIHRVLVDEVLRGEIFDTRFYHVGVDNLLWAKMKKAGEAIRCEQARVIHHHFSKGAEMDEVHKIAWNPEHVAHDRALLAEELAKI